MRAQKLQHHDGFRLLRQPGSLSGSVIGSEGATILDHLTSVSLYPSRSTAPPPTGRPIETVLPFVVLPPVPSASTPRHDSQID